MSAEEILSHPFVILIAGAIITGLLFPFFTNRWQSRQKDLELEFQLKLDLMKRINESVTETVMTSLFASRSSVQPTNDEITRVYRKWEINSAQIESDIEAYFPKTDVVKSWRTYSEHLKDFYTLFVNPPRKDRDPLEDSTQLMTKMRSYFSTNKNIDWQGLSEGEDNLKRRYDSFAELGREIINKKGTIIRQILGSHMQSIQRDSLLQRLNVRITRYRHIKS